MEGSIMTSIANIIVVVKVSVYEKAELTKRHSENSTPVQHLKSAPSDVCNSSDSAILS